VTNTLAIDDKDRIELYKMEYQQCVSCYQDLYNSIWRIFSYLSAVTAAVLVFGTQYLTISATVAASTIPLLVWFLFIYLPMDWYGHVRSDRLAEIEQGLSGDLKHFTLLKNNKKLEWRFWRARPHWRVIHGMCILAALLLISLGVSLWSAKSDGFFKSKEPSRFQGEVRVTSPVQVELRNPAVTPVPATAKTK
jgi:hypothetical protein